MSSDSKPSWMCAALFVLLLAAAPAPVAAQTAGDPVTMDDMDDDDGFDDWGLLGLIGLAGLMGRGRKDVDRVDRVETRRP